MTHQDTMNKVDLTYFYESESSNIANFRYDITAHVNVVNNESVVLTYELGSFSKNSAEVIKSTVIDSPM